MRKRKRGSQTPGKFSLKARLFERLKLFWFLLQLSCDTVIFEVQCLDAIDLCRCNACNLRNFLKMSFKHWSNYGRWSERVCIIFFGLTNHEPHDLILKQQVVGHSLTVCFLWSGTPTNQKERLKLKHFTEASTQVFLSLAGFHPAP